MHRKKSTRLCVSVACHLGDIVGKTRLRVGRDPDKEQRNEKATTTL